MSAAVQAQTIVPQPARVAGVRKETEDTFTLSVIPGNGHELPAFQPGQFSMIYCFGAAELPISISGDPECRDELQYTVRSVGKATQPAGAQQGRRMDRVARAVRTGLACRAGTRA